MRRDHTTFRYAARLTLAATALSVSTFPCLAGTTTIFAPGVTANSGWYDVNKKHSDQTPHKDVLYCWATAGACLIQYWQDRYVAAGNNLPQNLPNGKNSSLGYDLAIFDEFFNNWTSGAADPYVGLAWYFNGL